MSRKEQLIQTIEYLPDSVISILLDVARLYISGAEDDVLTPEDAEAIRKAEEEFEKGEYVRHEDIDWS